jgi:hypothetical protein
MLNVVGSAVAEAAARAASGIQPEEMAVLNATPRGSIACVYQVYEFRLWDLGIYKFGS